MLTVWKQGRTNEMGEYRFDGLHPAQDIVSAIPPERGAGAALSRPIPAMQLENGETYLPVGIQTKGRRFHQLCFKYSRCARQAATLDSSSQKLTGLRM